MYEIISRVMESRTPVSSQASRWRSDSHELAAQTLSPRRDVSSVAAGIRQQVAPRLQTKLRVSQPGDSSEREADRVADAVMRSAETAVVDRAAMEDEDARVDRAAMEDEDMRVDRAAMEDEDMQVDRAAMEDEDMQVDRAAMEDEELQAQSKASAVPEVTPALAARIHRVHGSGAPLARETRAFFEPRLGVDLGNVRVSAGSEAAKVARALDARAFTVGNHVTFGAGQYQPKTVEGKRLIAHELTHVIQQGGAAHVDGDHADENRKR